MNIEITRQNTPLLGSLLDQPSLLIIAIGVTLILGTLGITFFMIAFRAFRERSAVAGPFCVIGVMILALITCLVLMFSSIAQNESVDAAVAAHLEEAYGFEGITKVPNGPGDATSYSADGEYYRIEVTSYGELVVLDDVGSLVMPHAKAGAR